MDDFLTYRHSFNSGDLITSLPGIQKLYRLEKKKAVIYQRLNLPAGYDMNDPHPILDGDGRQVCMNEKTFEMMKPLIEAQEYVERFEIFRGEKVVFDFDTTRQDAQVPLQGGGSIHHWVFLMFPQLECDLGEQWIDAPNRQFRTGICLNFTERYRNPFIDYFFLKNYEEQLFFVGLEDEYKKFCAKWDLKIPYNPVKDFLELAMLIKNCRFFLGNQSMCWHIADAMKKKRLLEICTAFPNTFPTGKNGYAFIKQNALENRFERLLKETE